jgi:hypothetical protein
LGNVRQISQSDLETLPAGPPLASGAVVVRGEEQLEQYLLSWGQRCWISSWDVFNAYGFNVDTVIYNLSLLVLCKFPQGLDIT